MKVVFKNIEIAKLNVIKDQLNAFMTLKHAELIHQKHNPDTFYTNMLLYSNARELYFSFGSKMVKIYRAQGATHTSFSVMMHDAAILQFCCGFNYSNLTEFEKFTVDEFSNLIDQQLKSLV